MKWHSVFNGGGVPILAAVLWMAATGAARAGDPSDNHLLGDWSGLRSGLATRGAVLDLGYTSEDLHNTRGGSRRATRHAGQLGLGASVDLEKLVGWDRSSLRVSVTSRDGRNLNADAGIGALMQPAEIYGRGQTWRLSEFWFGHRLLDDRVLLKLGRMNVGSEFGDFECSFANLSFCGNQAGNIVGDYWYNWPISQWAAVGRANTGADTYAKLGLYQINPAYLQRNRGFSLNPHGTTGALLPMEFGWTPLLAGDRPGSYKAGAWYSTADRADVLADANGDAAQASGLGFRQKSGAYGVYIAAKQQVTRGRRDSPQSGLRVFLNIAQADRRTSTVDRTAEVGGIWRGLAAERPQDEIGVALATTHVNRRATETQDIAYAAGQRAYAGGTDETTAEAFYGWQARPWLLVRFTAQWIHAPGGVASRPDVVVVGTKTSISF